MGFGSFLGSVLKTGANFLKDNLPIIGDVMAAKDAWGNLSGKADSNRYAESANASNLAAQMMFAQQGLRWRVEDARAAGLHPLAALNAQIQPFTPSFSAPSMGQDLSRSMYATRTGGERIESQMAALTLERGQLENELLRSQIAKMRGQVGPPMPNVNMTGFDPNLLPGDVQLVPTQGGTYAVVPASDVKQNIEDMIVPETQWAARLVTSPAQPSYAYNPFTSEYVPIGSRTFTSRMARGWRRLKNIVNPNVSWDRSNSYR